MADSENFDLSQYIAKLLETIVDRLDTKVMSQTLADHLRQMTTTQGLKERQVLDTKQIDKIFKEFIRDWRDSTGSVSNSMQGAVTSLREKLKEMSSQGTDVTLKSALDNLSNLVSTLVHVSSQQIEAGKKPFINVNDPKAQSSVLLTGVMKDTYKALGGKLDALNDSFDKVLGFFQKGEQTERTKQRRFIDDLVDGLAKNKFIGGVLHDVVMFFGLMIASKLKEFGTFGKVLGGILFGAVQVLAAMLPGIIAKAVFDGVGRALRGIFSGTLGILKAIGTFFASKGGQVKETTKLLEKTTGTGITVTGKAITDAELAAAKVVGSGAAKTGASVAGAGAKLAGKQLLSRGFLGVGALWDAGDAIGSWKEGKKGAATAFGLAAGVGAAGLALAPVTGGASLLVGGVISAILSLLGVFLRDFRGDKKEASDYRKKMSSDVADIKRESWWDKVKNWWSGLGNSNSNSNSGSAGTGGRKGAGAGVFHPRGGAGGNGLPPQAFGSDIKLLSNAVYSAENRHLDPTKIDWAKANSVKPIFGKNNEVLNLGMMSQANAARAIEESMAKSKKENKKPYYEVIGSDLAAVDQFVTDTKKMDGSGVYAVRGTKESFLKTMAGLRAQGIDTTGMKITSTIGTLGSPGHVSPHTYNPGAAGHFSKDVVYDIGGGNIGRVTDKIMKRANSGLYYTLDEQNHWHVAESAAALQGRIEVNVPKQEVSTKEGHIKEMAQMHSMQDKPADPNQIQWQPSTSIKNAENKGAYMTPTGNREYLEAQSEMTKISLWGTDIC